MNNKTNVAVKAAPDGKSVVLTITESGGKAVAVNIPTDKIGLFVVGVLRAATACAHISRPVARPFSKESDQTHLLHYAMSNGVALADTDKPDVIGVTFAFGATELSLGLSRAALGPFGTALLAASADSSRPQ